MIVRDGLGYVISVFKGGEEKRGGGGERRGGVCVGGGGYGRGVGGGGGRGYLGKCPTTGFKPTRGG